MRTLGTMTDNKFRIVVAVRVPLQQFALRLLPLPSRYFEILLELVGKGQALFMFLFEDIPRSFNFSVRVLIWSWLDCPQ